MEHVQLVAVRNTIEAIKKRLKSLHCGTGGSKRWSADALTSPLSALRSPLLATHSQRGSRLQDGEAVPNGATLRRGCGSKRMLVRGVFGSVDCIIGTMGQEERVRTATPESGEAVSEGNVAENMTIPRKAIGKSPRLQSHGCDNVGLHGNGHTFRFTNHNNRKGVEERQF